MASSLIRALRQVQQIEICLYPSNAVEAALQLLPEEGALVIRSDQLHVRSLLDRAHGQTLRELVWIAVDVYRDEAKLGEVIHGPCRGQPGKGVMQPKRSEALAYGVCQVRPGPADVPKHDVMAAEAVVLRPSVKQQAGIARAQLVVVALEQELLVQAPHDPRHVAVIESRRVDQLLLSPPVERIL